MTTNEILNAMTGAPWGSIIESSDRIDALDGILKHLYAMRGYTVADGVQGEIDEAVAALEAKLSARFRHLTLGEINLALEEGVCGFFGKDKRLTIANYIEWLQAYSISDERRDASEMRYRQQKSLTQSQAAALLPAEDIARRNEECGRQCAMKEYRRFCENGGKLDIVVNGYAAMIFDWLLRHGKVNPSDDLIRKAHRLAKERKPIQQRGFTSLSLCEAVRDINPENAPAEKLLDYATKRELLTMYYSTLRSRGMQLTL